LKYLQKNLESLLNLQLEIGKDEAMSKQGLSEIVFLLDRSGSMASIKSDVIGGFNQFLEDQKKVPGEAIFTLVQFDSDIPHELVHSRVPLLTVSNLTDDTFQPRSWTPLYDAVGWTIDYLGKEIEKLSEEERPEIVIFAILTDGLENASKEYTKDGVFNRVRHQQDKYNWKFVYLGANQDAMAESQKLGIQLDPLANNVIGYAATSVGTRQAFASGTQSTTLYRNSK